MRSKHLFLVIFCVALFFSCAAKSLSAHKTLTSLNTDSEKIAAHPRLLLKQGEEKKINALIQKNPGMFLVHQAIIDDANKIIDKNQIIKTNWKDKSEEIINNYLPTKNTVTILMTSGASCPDTVVESVIRKIAGYYNVEDALEEVIQFWQSPN